MTEVINRVIDRRYSRYSENHIVQLSEFLMKKYQEEQSLPSYWHDIDQIEINQRNTKWTITSRPYRDDANDKDVEETLYNLANEQRNKS